MHSKQPRKITSPLPFMLFALTFTTAPALGGNIDFPHIEITGESRLNIEADMAIVNLDITIKSQTAKAAKLGSDEAVSSFISQIKTLGISQNSDNSQIIQSANIHLQPNYIYEKNQASRLVSYSASRNLRIQVNQLSKLNSLLDMALESGINRINHIELTSSKINVYRNKARLMAIQNAQRNAEILAQASGEVIDSVWKIKYRAQARQPMMMQLRNKGASRDMGESYQQGKLSIQDQVEVIYRLKRLTD